MSAVVKSDIGAQILFFHQRLSSWPDVLVPDFVPELSILLDPADVERLKVAGLLVVVCLAHSLQDAVLLSLSDIAVHDVEKLPVEAIAAPGSILAPGQVVVRSAVS